MQARSTNFIQNIGAENRRTAPRGCPEPKMEALSKMENRVKVLYSCDFASNHIQCSDNGRSEV